MEEKLKQLAMQFAEQRGITDIIPGGQGGGEPTGEAPGGLLSIISENSRAATWDRLLSESFDKQVEFFDKYPSVRYLIKRLIVENRTDEVYLQKWTAIILVDRSVNSITYKYFVSLVKPIPRCELQVNQN